MVEEYVGGVELISYSTEQLLANIKRQDLLFPPGTGYEYTDAGPILCQLITEKAGGISWWRFVTERLFIPALRDQMWTPQARANRVLGWLDYGFAWGVDRYRGVKIVMHSGYTGTGIVMLPEQRTAVIVFANLDNRFGTDAHGLALGVAGMYVPEISLLAMQPKADPDPARTKRVQDEFLRLAKGAPDYSHYSAAMLHGIQEAVTDFATRTPHLGAFQSLSFLEERNDDKLVYYRADFSNARLFLRVGFDSTGKINCFQVIHV